MAVIDVGLRPGDHSELKLIAQRLGRPTKEVAGILLEQAIRRESADMKTAPAEPATAR